MQTNAAALEALIDQFRRFPGIGRKTAQRMAFYVLDLPKEESKLLAQSILDAVEKLHRCAVCCNLTEDEICPLCRSDKRDKSLICVVEDSQDLIAIEKAGGYNGTYHVLHGSISPLEGIGPEDLTVKELLHRIQTDDVSEVILATNSDVDGDATALYISRLIKPLGIKTTRLAFGLPVGSDIQYADDVTIAKALEGRRSL